jgi:hypothetical protein
VTRPTKFAPGFRARAIDLYRFSEGWGRYRRLTSEVGADEAGVDTDMDGILRGSLMGPQDEPSPRIGARRRLVRQ